MSILYKFKVNFQRKLITLAALLATVFATMAEAGASRDEHSLLIIDSYYENSLWSNSIIVPVAQMLADVDSVHCEMVHLNNIAITDSAAYYSITDNVFAKYAAKPPKYVVMLGNTAFTMRDRIKQEWGNVPILLISRHLDYASLPYYFAGIDRPNVSRHHVGRIRDLRDEFNFTMILSPDYFEETIDMMVHMIPDMDELLLFADPLHHNRDLSYEISNYLAASYPQIRYEWVVGEPANNKILQEYIIFPHPKSGLLVSSWFYQRDNSLGYPSLTSGSINLIASSVNPFFSLRQPYLEIGSIGGVYPSQEHMIEHISYVVEKMLEGESMRNIPFYEDDKHETIVNYPILKGLKLPTSICPPGTVFIDKPPTFWERYKWPIIIGIILVAIFAFILVRHRIEQKRQIRMLKRHITFINNMPVPFAKTTVTFNKQKHIVNIQYQLMNDAFQHLLNENSTTDSAFLLFPPQFFAEKIQELQRTKKLVFFTYHFDSSDSYYEFILSEVSMPTIKSKKENVMEFDLFAVDITSRFKMESDLKQTSEKLNITLNVAKMVPWQWDIKSDMLIFDSDSPILSLMDNLKKKTKNGQILIEADMYIACMHPSDGNIIADIRRGLLNGDIKVFSAQYRILHTIDNYDKYDWIEINGAVTEYFDDGSPKIITGSLQIITDRKEQEQQMAEAIERANESDRLKSAFLANMSHEIRTPLNAIVGFSNLLTETDDPQKKREFSDIISRNNEMLLTLVNDVLDLAKIESNTIDINESAVDLNILMQTVEKTISMRLPKGVILNVVPGADSCHVYVDNNRLQQLLINLLSNACKFTEKGSISFGYEITADDMLYFFVKDTGVGLDQSQIENIFERFYKVDNFKQGTGLGLSICKSLVSKMGGQIGVKSRGLGKGAFFWFTLPYRPIPPEEVEKAMEEIDNFDFAPQQPTSLNARPKSALPLVLIAEDNLSNFKLAEQLLKDRFQIIHALNGQEAVNMYRDNDPDLIIMDINMPVLDGYAAVEDIRYLSTTVPIIGMTAYAFASDRKRILNSGFDAYVSKPINRASLFDAIDKVMNKKKQ